MNVDLDQLPMGLDPTFEGRVIEYEGQRAVSRFVPVVRMTAADDREALELLRVGYGGGPGWFHYPVDPAAHWQWKVHEFPGTAWMERIELDGRLVGMIIARWWPWLVRGELMPKREGVDLALDPSLQGTGLQGARYRYQRAHREELLPAPFALGLGTHPAQAHLGRTLGDEFVANEVRTLLRVLDARAFVRPVPAGEAEDTEGARTMVALRSARRRLPRPTWLRRAVWFARQARASALQRAPRPTARGWEIRTVDRFDERIDAFCAAASEPFDVIQLRNQRFLNWRYADPRSGPFLVRLAEEGGRILGFAATSMARDDAQLADVLTLPGREDVALTLVRDAVRQARLAGKHSVRCLLPRHHPAMAAVKHSGFFQVPSLGALSYNDFTPGHALSVLERPDAALHYVLGDADGV